MASRGANKGILAIDQGTTSSRAIVFSLDGAPVALAQQEFPQHYPRNGWVEHDPEDIWASTVAVCRAALEEASAKGIAVACAGITNQRETTLVWDRKTGKPLTNAIVWQDRRGAEACRRLAEAGADAMIRDRTGLVVDSYFSATKVKWILDEVDGARARAANGDLAFGTVDTFLLWRLTGGKVHATDATNAARTMLFDIREQRWDEDMLALFDVPAAMLPEVRDCAGPFGETDPAILGVGLPLTGIAGDQHAAVVGQACFRPGMIKSTYGTGCFVLMNAGEKPPAPGAGILGTVAYRLGGKTTYAVEGSIFNAGTTVQWLRDKLGLIDDAAATERLAEALPDNRGVYLVPAFTGLGAPHWDPDARGAIFGLTRETGAAEIVRAGLEAVAYQTRDLLDAMEAVGGETGGGETGTLLRVDGGMARNDWLMQFLADMLGTPVERPAVTETTALGAAFLAGLGAGLYASLDDVAAHWSAQARFDPALDAAARNRLLAGWRDRVARVRETA